MPQARVLRLLLRESTRWRVRVCAHANAGCLLEAATGTTKHGRALRERAVLLAKRAYVGHGPTPTSAARRAHAASERAAPPPRESTRWRVCVCAHANAGCLLEAATVTTKHGRAPRERAVPLAKRAYLGRGAGSNQRGAARVRQKCVLCASFRETACDGAFACAYMRTPAARWRPRLAHQSTAVHRGRGLSRWRNGLP